MNRPLSFSLRRAVFKGSRLSQARYLDRDTFRQWHIAVIRQRRPSIPMVRRPLLQGPAAASVLTNAGSSTVQPNVACALHSRIMGKVGPQVVSLSQRELRNESGRVLRAVGEGCSFVVTNNGTPVARIVPLEEPAPALRIVRPARRQGGRSSLRIARKAGAHSLTGSLDDLREDRQ